ncbi:MAG: hypothetical protein EAZ60_26320 [Oscillatoriales cyanobacterium]|nr:MAG: hypothetical protein EAZ83_28030 [Oscillatoriales cyanobacterium]TAF01167.1 MAG: hypothetical protein EAZ79_00615 [Oscillatoriales cyanobacterium]TAF17206.1 MAG: hypothetical protein EAZ73_22175 [Oscillatoriales cyanobacterium]TAF31199.1 MAG: hypothetical protein EAZ69_19900 [Oscillatoriales cyanobacterium]TAF51340.1 MAG: hypothetical protein EAZ60_26320 [Oscillatoriales cyanobacterium]
MRRRKFWDCYNALPSTVQATADRSYELLKADPSHPSLHFKKVGDYWSVRVGQAYRALGVEIKTGILWFWIGTHAEYDRLIGK